MEDLKKEYERALEMLEEMGYYMAFDIDDIKNELDNLEKLGYNCYFDSGKDKIIWEDFKNEY